MPVLTTATPVYSRVMDSAGIGMACASLQDWGEKLERLINADAAELGEIGIRCRQYANKAYSKDEFLNRFDGAFASIGIAIDCRFKLQRPLPQPPLLLAALERFQFGFAA